MSGAHVFIDRSQFPENVRRDLIDSLRARAINHKFHYESYKQAAKWLALHEAHSPARTDPSCLRIYDEAFAATATQLSGNAVHLVGLGCGGGQKEARLAESLRKRERRVIATVSDVSLPLALVSRDAVLPFADNCQTAVCDLLNADLEGMADKTDRNLPRLATLFGIIPNFEPSPLLSRVASLLRVGDWLLLSANLAPGADYAAGVEKILPQYDNELTRDWLMTLLLDLGFERDDGVLAFSIETDAAGLKRITAHFELNRSREIRVLGEHISFSASERIRIFFSYRHTVETMGAHSAAYGFNIQHHWLNDSAEEGVFLCRKA